ncbi:DUF1772 domain-containing protein [Leptolyngbya sp. 7M]|uniref:anthrone oxygenase family protein n=1 Tax=Leptolyngbya sp. 7M TaxID=2812896 RepID=UPI001B8D1B6A|nr:anthrone oxygenase family protein [Leptolyngbya sp. 7M]QYO67197.1 DUF1772 domain-containing protein [Leptolyngbya sp. 7M]
MRNLISALILVSLTMSGVVGGVFFIFSTTIMRSLAARPVEEAAETMNEINRVIVRTPFIALFLGNSLISILLIGLGLLDSAVPGRWLVVSGASFYLVGGFLVTIIFNVPRNNALVAADPGDPVAAGLIWQTYLREWTFWNHIRTIACIASTVLLALSLVKR